jgi:hypothetical protein
MSRYDKATSREIDERKERNKIRQMVFDEKDINALRAVRLALESYNRNKHLASTTAAIPAQATP